MGRTRTTEAIILKNNRIGEIHKGVIMLTPTEGLLRPIAHGAYSQKGKLRGTTNFLCSGTAYLYADPVRDSLKLTEMDVSAYFSGIRENLTRFYVATLWAELILLTYGSGDNTGELYVLLHSALELLDDATDELAGRINIQFLWRFLRLNGVEPDLDYCVVSGDALSPDEPVAFSRSDGGFCSRAYSQEHMIVWQPGAAAYMRHSATLSLPESLRVTPPAGAAVRIRRVLYALLQDQIERPIRTLESGAGIL
jgi:DNA repair protein RecO (recombination protein O)